MKLAVHKTESAQTKKKNSTSDRNSTRTVFVSADGDRVGGRAIPDAGPGEHPYAVFRPPSQLVEDERGMVKFHDGRLRVASSGLDAK